MLNKGIVNQQRLLSEQWVADAIAANHSDNDKRYGFQFWLNSGGEQLRWPSLPKDAYAMLGNKTTIGDDNSFAKYPVSASWLDQRYLSDGKKLSSTIKS